MNIKQRKLKKVTYELLKRYDEILEKHNINIIGEKTIKQVRVDTKKYDTSMIDLMFDETFFISENYNNILSDLIRLTSEYMNEDNTIRIRLMKYVNTPKILSEKSNIDEGFFTNFFKSIHKTIERDAIKKFNNDHPEMMQSVKKNKKKVDTIMKKYEHDLANEYGLSPEEFEDLMNNTKLD